VNPARAVRTDTTPPPETSLHFARGVQYVADLMTKTGEATDWTKLDAYLPPELRSNTSTPAADSSRCVRPSLSRLITRFKFPPTRPSRILLDACVYNDAAKHFVVVIDEARKTTDSELYSFVYDKVQAQIKVAEFLTLSFHGRLAAPDLLEGYERYQAANWDQFDAEPITPETLHYARRLMRIMPTSLGAPDVAPAADGSITLEWVPDDMTHKLDKLFLDIGPGEEWRAYWKMRNGKFDRLLGDGFPDDTKLTLKNLFDNLSA
jgi:hypothetical protein